jgi:dUTP pyrophosphatase
LKTWRQISVEAIPRSCNAAELKVLLINHGQAPFAIGRGLRIAQLVIAPVARIAWSERASLPASARDTGGFGSTGFDSTGTPR